MITKNKRHIHYIGMYILIVMIGIMSLITIPIGNFERHNSLVIITFLINGIIWFALLLAEVSKRPYSFRLMHWFFCLLFFFYAPVLQYAYDRFPWVAIRQDEVLVDSNLLLLFWTLAVLAGTKIRIKKGMGEKSKNSFIVVHWNNLDRIVPALTIISFLIFLYRVVTIGPQNLLARATSSGEEISGNSSLNMLIEHTMQAMSYFAASISILSWKENQYKKRNIILAAANTLFLVVSYFPTGLSRYAMAAIYGGILLTFSGKLLKKGRLFLQLFLAAFLVVLPFLNAFRNTAFSDVDILASFQNVLTNLSDVWLAGDYDAYTMLTLAVEYVQKNGLTWGRQLLGVVLFWVPRSVWITKPVGSGHMLATNLGWSFTNLSCPLPAEMLLNFGWLGIIVGGYFLGKLIAYLDKMYWKNVSLTGREPRRIDPLYHCIIFFFFFMCRGDLLSSVAYMMSYIAVWVIVISVTKLSTT